MTSNWDPQATFCRIKCLLDVGQSGQSAEPTLQQVGQRLGAQGDGPLGLVVGDGELLHAQLLGHLGLRAVVDQRAAQQLCREDTQTHTQTDK